MKTRILLITFFSFTLFLFVFTTSCKKDSSSNAESSESIAQEMATAESAFDDDAMYADESFLSMSMLKSGNIIKHPFAPCATFSVDTTGGHRTRTIDFGSTNCLCNDGKYRRGKIVITFTAPRIKPGSVITTTFENYFVNDNQVSGTTTVTNNGLNDSNNLSWTITIDKTLTFKTGEVAHWAGTRTREWIEGMKTPLDWTDDVYSVTGTSTRTRPNGDTRTCTILTPLRKEMDCHHFVSGTVSIVRTGKPDILLDYGTGDCDDLATITVDGETKTIKI